MKDYYHFSANDFAMDDSFRAWVWKPTAESNANWREWIAKHPDKSAEVEAAIALLKRLSFPEYSMSDAEMSTLWYNIKEADATSVGSRLISQPSSPSVLWRWSAVAATVLLAVGLALYLVDLNRNTFSHETAFGETRQIVLPDSSTVMLNANSNIRFRNDWSEKDTREVWLEGEAFFEVVHTVNHQPFQVKVSDGLAVEVLGTSFNVYHRQADTKVVLNSGQISLSFPASSNEEKIVMEPGELVEYSNNRYSKRKVNAEIYAAWTDNKVILDQTSLREMIAMAKDNYGINIEVASEKMLEQTVSGSMPVGDAESFVLQIARVFQLKAKKEKKHYLLKE